MVKQPPHHGRHCRVMDTCLWRRVQLQTFHRVFKIVLSLAVHLEERLRVRQSVNLLGQHSVRQKHTVWVFCQQQTRLYAVGRKAVCKASNGRMVM